ncbi:MAG: hypothetical protein HY270_17810 [Deltaproteobacteria bacterium]|nr:hypothetical protein [Deltaproteobacteria bacterium]
MNRPWDFRRCLALVVALGLVAASPAWARHFGKLPIAARIDAYVGAKPDSVTTIAVWNVRARKRLVQLYVTKLQVNTGNVAYFDIISAFEPYRIPFSLLGSDAAVDQLLNAPANQEVRIMGNFQLAVVPGTFFISSVEVREPPTPAAR